MKRFVDLNLEKFAVVIWRSLKYPQPLDLLIDHLLVVVEQEIKPDINNKLKQFLDVLTQKKCLIIFDDVQNIFVNGQLAGQYQPEYENYQHLFTEITEIEHQSSVILISQEKCDEMHCLDEELYPLKCIEIQGLNEIQLLKSYGLQNEDSWLKLINLYEGNPAYLKSISILIQKMFDGNVAEFLAENTLIITETMQANLRAIFNRLSPLEKAIILQMSKLEQPISKEQLKLNLELSATDFIQGLQSLQKRYLVTKIKWEQTLFQLSPVFQEYLIKYYQL